MSPNQQQNLPALIQAIPMPAMYEDSTHQLWDCTTKDGALILKVCNNQTVADSSFWQAMTLLFNVDLPMQLGDFDHLYKKLSQLSILKIPRYIASSSKIEDAPAFIACQKLAGKMVVSTDVNDAMVIQFTQHISTLHQHQHTTWGRLNRAEFDAKHWPMRLQESLKYLANKRDDIPSNFLNEALALAGKCKTDSFVPIMLDLRWDQFLQQQGQLTALVDLDAFVYAPKELELVLIEYLLNDQQAQLFSSQYQQILPLPDLSQVRKPYRLLLFMMNVLGEKDIDIWMNAVYRW